MPSASLVGWINDRMPALNEIDVQCSACNIARPVNALLLEENIRGYILLLSAHFQGYCRDLYSECSQFVAAHIRPRLRFIVQQQFTANRALDRGNPNIDNIKTDFNRFGLSLDMATVDPANHARLADLKELNRWRNIAAHQGVVPATGLPPLDVVQAWRISCGGLATSLDGTMYNQLRATLNKRPWVP